jgi:RNA polymerase sigma-70 factor (ECF subfamily)
LRRALPVDAVEDVLQETYIAVWKGAARHNGEGAVGAWIWGIARRQAAL